MPGVIESVTDDEAFEQPPIVLVLSGWSDGPLDELRLRCHHIDFVTVTIPTPPVGAAWLRNPYVAALVVLAGLTGSACELAAAVFPSSVGRAVKLGVVVLTLALARYLVARLVRFAITRGVEEAKLHIARHRPDAIVGFSWGGGVVWELISQGAWAGPALLLAPTVCALAKVAMKPPPWPTLPDGVHVDVVTPEFDSFCPKSQANLFSACGCHCYTVADHHPMLGEDTGVEIAALLRRAVPPAHDDYASS